jgi:AhpD family alkylhydroperoxidase
MIGAAESAAPDAGDRYSRAPRTFGEESVMATQRNARAHDPTIRAEAGTQARVTATPVANGTAVVAETGRGPYKPIIRWGEFGRSTVGLARRSADLRAIWSGGRLAPAFREEIMVAAAGANSCRQCSFAHREWALAEGLPEAELAALEGLDAEWFDPQRWAALAWAQAVTHSDFGDIPEIIDANFRRQFSRQEQADIELVVRVINWTNRGTNTVDAALSRLRGSAVPGSGLLRELVALTAYALIAPPVLILLSIKQRRGLISTIAGMKPFFRTFEARGDRPSGQS